MKRRRNGDIEQNSAADDDNFAADDWADVAVPRDTMIALNLMRSQFPQLEQSSLKPFVLKSQLYSSIRDRTSVDRELEAMQQEQVIRVFKLQSGQNDFAIMLLNDYLEQIHDVKKRMEASKTMVLDWFVEHVIPSQKGVGVSDAILMSLLSRGGEVSDNHLTTLMNAGLLVRQNADPDRYWFSIPNIGFVLKSLTKGRKELMQFLSKRPYKQILISQLEKRKLKMSLLDIRFHIRDLVGSDKISLIPSPSGTIIQGT